jgi:hypothetical protein
MNTPASHNELIKETADLIRQYDPALANLWLTQPFQRVGMAIAFANGFLHTGKKLGIDHPAAKVVMKVACADKRIRGLANRPA